MNSQKAKEYLISYRPELGEPADPETSAALELVRQDPELADWFQQQQAFHTTIRRDFRELAVPPDLKQKILSQAVPVRPRIFWLNRYHYLAAAAALVFLLVLAAFWFHPHQERRLSDYRARMAKFALRDYRMDLVTNDLHRIQSFLAQRGAPADYNLNPKLQSMPGLGCAALKWQNQPVSLICFRLGEQELLWLFVTPQTTLQDPPPSHPQFQTVGKLMTAAWSQAGKTYLLAAIGDQDLLQQYLQ